MGYSEFLENRNFHTVILLSYRIELFVSRVCCLYMIEFWTCLSFGSRFFFFFPYKRCILISMNIKIFMFWRDTQYYTRAKLLPLPELVLVLVSVSHVFLLNIFTLKKNSFPDSVVQVSGNN